MMLTFHSGMALLNLLCSLLITGHDDGITLVGVRVSEWLV